MNNSMTTITYSSQKLQKEGKEHQQFIERIKQEVAQEYDNLSNPLPLFTQLGSDQE